MPCLDFHDWFNSFAQHLYEVTGLFLNLSMYKLGVSPTHFIILCSLANINKVPSVMFELNFVR